jgi:putative membrane protein
VLHTHHAAFESFSVSIALILAALVYVRGWVRIRRRGVNTIQGWHAASFLLGVFFVWLALASPIAALDHELLTVHMVQHLLLMALAPPLIWLGAPVMPLIHGLPQRFLEGLIVPLFRWPLMKRLRKAMANQAVCWLAAAGVLVGWHVPALFMLGLESGIWHAIEQASFLITGLLFWSPVLQSRRTAPNGSEWPILLYLFLATLPCDILSGFLVFCDRVVYPVYFSSTRTPGFSPLEDQQCAGALMWTCVTVVYFIAGTILTARLLSPETSRHNWVVRSDSPLSASTQTTRSSLEVV